jgi:hypothetical protein
MASKSKYKINTFVAKYLAIKSENAKEAKLLTHLIEPCCKPLFPYHP